MFDRQGSEYASANILQLYPNNIFYCWTFESIEMSHHVKLLEIQIKMEYFDTIMSSELQEVKHQKI